MGDFPCGIVVKNPPSNAGHLGLIPGWGTENPHDGRGGNPGGGSGSFVMVVVDGVQAEAESRETQGI